MSLVRFAVASVFCVSTAASAATTNYSSETAFAAALTGDFTLVNLDAPPLAGFASGYRVDDALPAAALLGLGIDMINFNAPVVGGQAFQIPTGGRDRLILNGAAFGGTIAANFTSAVNGVGARSNLGDGGRVRIFSGANLGGSFLGEFGFSGSSFGGITSDQTIGSAQFTCDFNFDLACGVYDIQFGTFEAGNALPEPQSWALMLIGFGAVGTCLRRTGSRLDHRAQGALGARPNAC